MNSTTRLAAYCQSDTGLRRSRNEDVCSVSIEHRYFMVADGIGGAAAGDIASDLFLQTVSQTFKRKTKMTLAEGKEQVKSCFTLSNTRILEHIALNPSHSGMGCTAELLVICGDMFILGHVGDSRTYCYLDKKIEQLTVDHSLVQEQLSQGLISKTEAEKSTFKNVLLRAVGVDAGVEVDIFCGKIVPGSIFLLCTDGLHNMVNIENIEPVLAYEAPLSLKTEMLVNMANDAGGSDNISVALVEIL